MIAENIVPLMAGFAAGLILGFTWGLYKGKKSFYKAVSAHFSMRRK